MGSFAEDVEVLGPGNDVDGVCHGCDEVFEGDEEGEFEASRENRMLSALKIYKEEVNVASYYEEIDKIIYRLKEDYLQLVEE